MQLKVTQNTAKSIPANKRYLNELDETQYEGIQVGVIYKIYGLMIVNDRVDSLICPNEGRPMWVPQHIYELSCEKVIADWKVKIIDERDDYKLLKYSFGIGMLMGYNRLIESYSHYIGILEGNKEELQYFYQYIK
ncbi:hypothetical protein CQ054_22730 [Ochrobactrum sp. MYb29]|uniref:hypothetical protein n=1 Tax=Brucella pituitosa TaxID=571256 RepID=UPI000C270A98|nr:hypothetical protein [Brucella pituitosa]PJO45642.1 hypothetical protein CWE02_23280 [Brucella pituitosa]PRA75730.1 hypothetical protein CQ054_22730 [Ochrobactrum sp. MYb29]